VSDKAGASPIPHIPYVPGADSADDLRERAARILDSRLFAEVAAALAGDRTLAADRAGFGRYRLRPRVLTDISRIDTTVEILGALLDAPLYTCPFDGVGRIHPDGERAIARAAAETRTLFVLSDRPSDPLEDVVNVAGPARWHELRWRGDDGLFAERSRRTEDAGFRAIVLNLGGHSWETIRRLRRSIRVPLVVKGIVSADDAARALTVGAGAVIVSNHTGRELDSRPGAIEVLDDVLEAVAGRVPVLLDGGVRRSSDVAIALGLGAAAVGLGRPLLWALACGGHSTLTAYVQDFVGDVRRTFGMLGVSSVKALTRSHVSLRDQYLTDAAIAAYPQTKKAEAQHADDPALARGSSSLTVIAEDPTTSL
jgi:isopentenyl diphosphate isomerase/L-lactate dehydrogenase-like FMN-dependent dehydrogenase